ncbi:hypothetical protein [Ammoniphilus resinae]|uniref:Uncharacterized protein n=1 Tax=Ammoniphilus resinae TaxID=861532 RepID=A0ABS4GSM8_9BACL|nr:hypothetical protein [Ammoniphilus resinae]MBP1933288.1 hypothetical protein [Ammoniphilus resinae]
MLAPKNIVHWPDLSFVKFCEETFGINRGIYNTIDLWFFNKGVKEIVKRRNILLGFLKYLSEPNNSNEKNQKIKIGKKGLSFRLIDYWIEQENS